MRIPLTQGFEAVVDPEDAVLLIQHRWHVSNERPNGVRYAVTNIKKCKVYMHRLLLPNAISVDHINCDGLDNRRANLRSANKSQQAQNSRGMTRRVSQFKGVSWWDRPRWIPRSKTGIWKAAINVNGRTIVKYAKTEVAAAQAYNEMAREHFGEFARVNVIEETS